MPFCGECGTQTEVDARFCSECGAVVSAGRSGGSSTRSVVFADSGEKTEGSKLSLGAAILALVCFFMPWVKGCGMAVSGFDIATKGPTQEFGSPEALLLFVIPLSAAFIIWLMVKVIKGQVRRTAAGSGAIMASLAALLIQGVLYFSLKAKMRDLPFDIFTFWFALSVLSFVCTAIGGYLLRHHTRSD